MKALSFDGEKLIGHHFTLGFFNRGESVRRIHDAIYFLSARKNDLVRKYVYQALELIRNAQHSAFIVCPGLIAQVLNERHDAENHGRLSEIGDRLQCIYTDCLKLPVYAQSSPNVINFQAYKKYRASETAIVNDLTQVVYLLLEYEKINL